MTWTTHYGQLRATPREGWLLTVYATSGWAVDHHGTERAYGTASTREQAQEHAEKLYHALAALAEVARECGARVSV